MDKNEWYSVFDKYCKKLRIVPAWDVKLEFVEDPLWRKTGDFKVDLSSNFAEGLLNMGTAGEYLTMGAVVNSFLDTYQADGIEITAGGAVIETGHTSFEGVLNHFDSNESQ